MKYSKRILSLILAVLVIASLLCGCETTEDKMNALCGNWYREAVCSEDLATSVLENMDLYEEEIVFADLNSLKLLYIAEFNMDGTYRFYLDEDASIALVRQFLAGVFDALYVNRASLNDTYERDFAAMTEEEFQQFYADLYSETDFETFLDNRAENAFYYDDPVETGTFYIKDNAMMMTEDVQDGELPSPEESLPYTIDGITLTLRYSDDTHVYSRNA